MFHFKELSFDIKIIFLVHFEFAILLQDRCSPLNLCFVLIDILNKTWKNEDSSWKKTQKLIRLGISLYLPVSLGNLFGPSSFLFQFFIFLSQKHHHFLFDQTNSMRAHKTLLPDFPAKNRRKIRKITGPRHHYNCLIVASNGSMKDSNYKNHFSAWEITSTS